HLLGRADVAARAVEVGADVVDQDLGAFLRHQERNGAADAAARPGDDRDLAFDNAWHNHLQVMPGLVPGIHAFAPLSKTGMAGKSPAMTAECDATTEPSPRPRSQPRRSAAASPTARPR